MNQQSRLKPSIPTGQRPPVNHVYTFPSTGIPGASRTAGPFLQNPWDDPQIGARPRVRSMNEPHHYPAQNPGAGFDAAISFPEPQLSQTPISNSSRLPLPPRNLQHRHSRSEFRPQYQPSVPLHRSGSGVPTPPVSSYHAANETKHPPEVCLYLPSFTFGELSRISQGRRGWRRYRWIL